MGASRRIQVTKNYRMFGRNPENRPVDIKKHKKLLESMKTYGFLQSFPIVVRRDKNGSLTLKDGQHRLAIAETLGLSVSWIEEDVDFDIAKINITSKVWQNRDYAEKFALEGNQEYQAGLDFSKKHGLAIGTAFSLLAGTITFSNIDEDFRDGKFKVKDQKWADDVASIYGPMTVLSSALKTARFIEACMAVCRVKGFDSQRLIAGAERCREKLVSYSTRDAFLDMIEDVYNFGRKNIASLKIEAMKTMRERNAIVKSKREKKEKEATQKPGMSETH